MYFNNLPESWVFFFWLGLLKLSSVIGQARDLKLRLFNWNILWETMVSHEKAGRILSIIMVDL